MPQRHRFVAPLLLLLAVLLVLANFLSKEQAGRTTKGTIVGKLQWKFEKGKPFYQEMSTEMKQAMHVIRYADGYHAEGEADGLPEL